MPRAGPDGVWIVPASPDERAEALSLVFRRLAEDERCGQVGVILADEGLSEADWEGLLTARRGGRLVGAVFSRIQPGKAAVVWPPQTLPDEPAVTGARLLDATCAFLARHRARIAQCLLGAESQTDDVVLRQAGFQPLTSLFYMVSLAIEFPEVLPMGPLEFEPYCRENHGRLVEIVETTYEQTLDCPRLNGIRATEDVLAGYRASGKFHPSRWLIVTHQARDVGCLLLADYPQQENWELVYMGLAPCARGRGWGALVARHAQWLARQAGRPRLVLAVDAANSPAVRMYTALGFQAWDRRSVYLRIFD